MIICNALLLVLSYCVAAVKRRPILHYCVVILHCIYFWFSGIVITFEEIVSLMR